MHATQQGNNAHSFLGLFNPGEACRTHEVKMGGQDAKLRHRAIQGICADSENRYLCLPVLC